MRIAVDLYLEDNEPWYTGKQRLVHTTDQIIAAALVSDHHGVTAGARDITRNRSHPYAPMDINNLT